MFCVKCGAQLPENSSFCNKCGSPVPSAMYASVQEPQNHVLERNTEMQPGIQLLAYEPAVQYIPVAAPVEQSIVVLPVEQQAQGSVSGDAPKPHRSRKVMYILAAVVVALIVSLVAFLIIPRGERSQTLNRTIFVDDDSFELGAVYDPGELEDEYAGCEPGIMYTYDGDKAILEFHPESQIAAIFQFEKNQNGDLLLMSAQLSGPSDISGASANEGFSIAGIEIGDSLEDVLEKQPELWTYVHFSNRQIGRKWYFYADANGNVIPANEFTEPMLNAYETDDYGDRVLAYQVWLNSDGEVYLVSAHVWTGAK